MRFFKIIFWVLWRVWFYIMMALPIFAMLPFLIISVMKERWYPAFFFMARIWARFILITTGFYTIIDNIQKIEKGKSYMFVANHTSMADIMLMLVTVNNPFVFVGKKELSKIPIFGYFYKRACILVDRSSAESRKEVFEKAQNRLNQGMSICIFPEGGVPDESILLDTFKDGAFRLAIEHQIPIVPITFADNKERMSYTFLSGSVGRMRAKVHEFVPTENKTLDCKKEIKEQVWAVIYNQLLVFQKS